MAKVVVSGTIEKIDQYAQGAKTIARLVEEYTANNGEVWRRKWSVWFNTMQEQLTNGDWVELEGELSTKVSEWVNKEGQTKQIIDHNLNNPSIVRHVVHGVEPVRDLDDERKYGRAGAPF